MKPSRLIPTKTDAFMTSSFCRPACAERFAPSGFVNSTCQDSTTPSMTPKGLAKEKAARVNHSDLRHIVAAHTGLEPVISALRGQRVNQLHQCAAVARIIESHHV